MGFCQDKSYMTVWSIEPSATGRTTKVRLSSSKKNRQTGEYEQDFNGFCTFIGDANAKAASLKEKDRIKLKECDVETRYDKESKREYVNYKVFSFEMAGTYPQQGNGTQKATAAADPTPTAVDDDEIPF